MTFKSNRSQIIEEQEFGHSSLPPTAPALLFANGASISPLDEGTVWMSGGRHALCRLGHPPRFEHLALRAFWTIAGGGPFYPFPRGAKWGPGKRVSPDTPSQLTWPLLNSLPLSACTSLFLSPPSWHSQQNNNNSTSINHSIQSASFTAPSASCTMSPWIPFTALEAPFTDKETEGQGSIVPGQKGLGKEGQVKKVSRHGQWSWKFPWERHLQQLSKALKYPYPLTSYFCVWESARRK